MLTEHLMIGTVVKAQGIKGLVKIKPETDNPERFLALTTVLVLKDGNYQAVTIDDIDVREGFVYCHMDHAVSRDAADMQRGWQLFVSRADAVVLPEDRHFVTDLLGCRVYGKQGEPVGELQEVLQPGANDVYVIKTASGRILLPALKRVVLSIDIPSKRIVVNTALFEEVAVIED
jgi:16S rRNA processing protein RimM